jgi:dihydroflavonol-4-reductase
MPKALLTGATGFVGGALLRELLRRGWEVRVLVRAGADPRNLEGHPAAFEHAVGDILDRQSLRRAMLGCDTVFHVAARYSLWNPRPDEIYRDNVDGTRNVLETAGELGVRRIVHTSTVGVFKLPADGAPVDESAVSSRGDCRGHYKRSKLLAEECALTHAERGLPVVVVNPSTPIGPNDIKPTPTGQIILDFLRRRMPAYTDTGLNLVPVEDVAVGHILAAEKGQPGRRYILGGENLTLRTILQELSALTGLPPPRFRVPRRWLLPLSTVSTCIARVTGRPPLVPWEAACMAQRHMYFDSTRARTELGFTPGSVASALERSLQWFLANGYARPLARELIPARRMS